MMKKLVWNLSFVELESVIVIGGGTAVIVASVIAIIFTVVH